MDTQLEWHGEKAYGHCDVCGKLVQVNKPLLGGLHICLSACDRAGRHLDERTRQRGPFWNSHTETYCGKCGAVDRGER